MKYRRAEVSDFLAIAALDREAWGQNRNATYIPDGEHVWRIWVEHALVFCAVADDARIAGAILAFPGLDDIYCLHKVFVDPALRGQGCGRALFSLLLDEIDKAPRPCFLTVDPQNEAALKLYEKWGFSERKMVKGYYRDAEDRFVLTRPSINK